MPESPWAAIAPALLTGICLSFVLEFLLLPRPLPNWRRPLSAVATHTGIVILLYVMELLLFRRPWFAMANVLALLLFTVLVSNAKYHSLREPFLYQDFEYFTDALKHPRLYLPFFGIARTLLAAAGIVGALVAGMMLEAPLLISSHPGFWIIGVGALAVSGIGLVWLGSAIEPPMSCEPCNDLTRLGQLASLWYYGRDERRHQSGAAPTAGIFHHPDHVNADHGRPDLVVVQSESFFDPRRCFSGIRPEVLAQFDRLKASSALHGRLTVPAWGANTVRTEYAFLSGLDAEKLGIHQFNPYRWIARQGIPTLAGFLKHLGYRTVCIHPYPSSFYCRDAVYPLIGFDEFVDIDGFQGTVHTGPYVSDVAVAAKIDEIMEENRRRTDRPPLFIFVITMENHGPLHLETISAGDVAAFHAATPPPGCEDLTVYLRHLSNADRMVKMIHDTLEQSDREGWLCFFGDHLPIMAKVYQRLGDPDGDSEYVLWGNRGGSGLAQQTDMRVEDLAGQLLKHAGVLGDISRELP